MEPPQAPDEAPPQSGSSTTRSALRFSALSLPARLAVAAVAGVLALTVAVHMAMVTFWVAPSDNVVRSQYGDAMRTYVGNDFHQGWSLFAPNPNRASYHLEVRVEQRGADGTEVTDWVDLSAEEQERMRYSIVPSKTENVQLRRAINYFQTSHDDEGNPTTASGPLMDRYLRRLVLERMEDHVDLDRVERVQFRITTWRIEPPEWTDGSGSGGVSRDEYPWWEISDADLPGGSRAEEASR